MNKLLILAAGSGSRMGLMGEVFNKALFPIEGKAIISHIIENVNVEEIVMAVGYKSQQIKDYCAVFHADINIKFIDVDNYDRPGSGPGYSMLCCKQELLCPFYIVTADSLVTDKLPDIDCNWIGIGDVDDLKNYATCDCDKNGYLTDFRNKSSSFLPFAFTGVLAVQDYELFWLRFEDYLNEKTDQEVEFVGAFYKPFFAQIKTINIPWKDVGRRNLYLNLYEKTKGVDDYDLKKLDHEELTFIYKKKVGKIADVTDIAKKKKRKKILNNFTPNLSHLKLENILVHDFINGKNLYQHANSEVYLNFFKWAKNSLFRQVCDKPADFESCCMKFYKQKTEERILKFYERFPEMNSDLIISNILCKNAFYYMEKIDWQLLCQNSIPYVFHGDLNFGNIIMKEDNHFVLIDWRNEFCNLEIGDLYYDFAKLQAGCSINFYKCCKDKRYFHKIEKNIYDYNWISTSEEQIFLYEFKNWLKENNFDCKKVEILSYLILLNMAPLHLDNFAKYLYCQAIRCLSVFLEKN